MSQQRKAAAPAARRGVTAPAPLGPAAARRDVRRIVGTGETEKAKGVDRSLYELERLADGGVTLLFHPRDVVQWSDRLAESFGRYIAHVFPGTSRAEAMECARALGVHWVVELPPHVESLPYVPVTIQGPLHAGVLAWFHDRHPELAPQEPASGSYHLADTAAEGGRASGRAPEPIKPVDQMTTAEKIGEAVLRALGMLPGEIGERLKELLTPEALATMAAFTTAYIVSQVTPVGWVADIIVGGLIAATVLMLGSEAIEVVKLLIGFAQKASNATSERDLDQAAQLLAAAVSKVGVDIILAILFHKAGKAMDLKPPGPRSPGLVEVLEVGGGKVKALLTEAPATADLVTPSGQVVRVPVGEVPQPLMMEGPRGAGKGAGKGAARGTGKGSGRGAAGKGAPAEGPAPEAPAELPGKSLAAADALAKKKPEAPGELLKDAGKLATEAGEAAAAVADPRTSAKGRVLAQIARAKDLKTQIYTEIQEAVQSAKRLLSREQRAEIDGEKADLAREAGRVAEEEARLQKQLAELDVTPYQRARAYSYSDGAAKEVIRRARGLDEMSGKPLQEPSIDHVVPVEEIVEFDGYNRLLWQDQQAVLSRVDNLRLMEKALNSSKSNRRWVNWEAGRRAYGQAVWELMVQLEGQLRLAIQADIKARGAVRHR